MRGRKKLSPFQALLQEIENYLYDLQLAAQLSDSENEPLDTMFMLGQRSAIKSILERAYAIYQRDHFHEPLEVLPASDAEKYLREFLKKESD